jgi:predicted transcriptional regulator
MGALKDDQEERLAKLFGSGSRAKIIDLLLSQVGRAFYQREIMYETGLSLHPTQRELENLLNLGIIKKRETRDRVYYEVDAHSPFFKPLCEICEAAYKKGEEGESF